MKFHSKVFVSAFTLGLMLFISPSVQDSASAQDFDAELVQAKVTFDEPELKGLLSQESIDQLVEQADGDDITIHNVSYGDSEVLMDFQPFGTYATTYSVNSKKFTHRSPLAAQQYASVARGKTVTMSSTFTSTNTMSVSGGIPTGAASKIKASIGSTTKYTVKKGITLKGPPNGYASRNYYVTKYQDNGTFNLVADYPSGKITTTKKNYSTPSSQDPYVDWSRDIK